MTPGNIHRILLYRIGIKALLRAQRRFIYAMVVIKHLQHTSAKSEPEFTFTANDESCRPWLD
jgi:hypothetical protein